MQRVNKPNSGGRVESSYYNSSSETMVIRKPVHIRFNSPEIERFPIALNNASFPNSSFPYFYSNRPNSEVIATNRILQNLPHTLYKFSFTKVPPNCSNRLSRTKDSQRAFSHQPRDALRYNDVDNAVDEEGGDEGRGTNNWTVPIVQRIRGRHLATLGPSPTVPTVSLISADSRPINHGAGDAHGSRTISAIFHAS